MRIFKSVDIPNAIVTLGFRSSWEEDASLRFKDRIICFGMFIRDVDERQVVLLVATNSRYLSYQVVGICFVK